MADSRRHAVRYRGWWIVGLIGIGTLGLFSAAVALVTLRVARLVLVPATDRPQDVVVLGVDRKANTVTLTDHIDAMVPGDHSLFFADEKGHAKIGTILAHSTGSVTRRLLAEERGELKRGDKARLSGLFYLSPDELAYRHQEVMVDTELGASPAWLVPAANPSGRWVIQVHGRGVDRREAIRAIPAFHESGYTSLLISYRNDGVAPPSLDGRYALGDTEWRDVDAAVQYALEHGAADIVLMGWSMGGALVLQQVTRSQLAGRVRGVILDSPVIDWVSVLNHHAGALRVPAGISSVAFALITRPWGRHLTGQSEAIDLRRLDFVRRAGELTIPILLMHSDSDTYVPSTDSRTLAKLRPDIVTLESFTGAGHTRLWNYDSRRWNAAIRNWLDRL